MQVVVQKKTLFEACLNCEGRRRHFMVFHSWVCVPTGGAGLKKETARMLDNRQSCDRHHIARQKRPLFFDGFNIFASAGLLGLVNPAAALGDEALGKRGEGCRASPLLRRGRTVQTLANVYEDRAAEYPRAAQQTDDPVFCRLLLMLALQWKLAGQQEAKSKDALTSLASTYPQPLDESRSRDGEPIRHSE